MQPVNLQSGTRICERKNIMNSIIRYFDLVSNLRPTAATATARGKKLPPIWPQYVVLVLGVLIQPFLAAYQQTRAWNFTGLAGRLLFAVIVGIVILPGVYKNSFDPEKPLFIQLCLLFVAGMGWESLLRTAMSAVGG